MLGTITYVVHFAAPYILFFLERYGAFLPSYFIYAVFSSILLG